MLTEIDFEHVKQFCCHLPTGMIVISQKIEITLILRNK